MTAPMPAALQAGHAAHAGHGTSPAVLILLGFAAVLGYGISLYIWPWRPCPRCKGTGTKRGSTPRRFGPCRRCQGTRHVQRIGSRFVARTVLSVRSEIGRERQRRRDAKASQRTQEPRQAENRPPGYPPRPY